MRILKHLVVVFIVLSNLAAFCSVALEKAYNKPFWGDESTDVFTTLPSKPKDMFF